MKNQSVTVASSFPCLAASNFAEKVLQSIVDVVCVLDHQGIIRFVSTASTQLFGYTADEMTEKPLLDFIDKADTEKTAGLLTHRQPGRSAFHFENRFIKKDGRLVNLLWTARPDEGDGLLYCVARDGSEKNGLEQRLVKAQHMARVANYEYDVANNYYTYYSDTIFEIFGLDRQQHPQFTSALFWSLVHPDDVERVRHSISLPEGLYSSQLEYRVIRPDGSLVYINRLREVVYDAAGKPVKTIGTIQDITDRKQIEQAYQQSEERFRTLVQNGNDMLGIIDAEANYIFVAPNVRGQLGYNASDMIGRNALSYIHPDDLERVMAVLQEIGEQITMTVGPFRFQNSEGEWRWVECTVSNQLQNPAISGLVVNSKDVTEKKHREDALRQSEQRFKALVQNGSDLIVVIDEKAVFSYVSDNAVAILGYTDTELMGRTAFDFIHPDDRLKVEQEIYRVLTDHVAAKGVRHRFLHKDGRWIWLESRGSDHQETAAIGGILVNARNIDDQVKLQRRLDRERINKQREITSAVIKAQEIERSQLGLELHDNVNQILTTVKLYNEMYLTGYVQEKVLLEKSTQYTQDCINEIRSISKRLSAPTLGKISLQDSIKELVNSINLTRRLEIIYLPQGLRHRVISEDLHLAVYRIVQEGLNNILKYSQAQVACIEIKMDEGQLLVKITDDGKGFDMAAKRAGIGITNMKTRAENLNGMFTISSAPGQGCVIQISFPCEERIEALP